MTQQVVIIGTGPAGLTAAIYAARAALKPVIYAGIQHGGQLTTTTEVENYPGFADAIMGPELMQAMTGQAERLGVEIIYDEITKVDFSSSSPLQLWAGEKQITTKAVIIATGATARTLGLPQEKELMGRGLSTCATCDGFFYKGKRVLVVGGGDSAMEESLYLSKLCSEVILVHRRSQFRASPIMLERARNNSKITFKTPYQVETTHADKSGLQAVSIVNCENGDSEKIATEGLFMAIGHTPNSSPFSSYVHTDEHGYIHIDASTQTNVKGVFAAGDISDSVYRQAVTAAGMGCQAAIQAQRYLEALG